MRKLLADIPYFLEAANCPSFTQAAEVLGIPLATLSRRIAAMEKHLGTRLFFRNTRTIGLTEAGKDFLESCTFIMAEANSATERLALHQTEPSGTIRLSIEAFVFHCCMHGMFGTFSQQYPKIAFSIIFSTEWKDLNREPFDLDIRTGPVPYPDLKVRKLLSFRPALYCSKKALENHSEPEQPNDLIKFPFIAQSQEVHCLVTFHKDGQVKSVAVQPTHMVQSVGLALELLLAGQGAATFIPQLVQAFDKKGELVQLLPDWPLAEVDINLAMPAEQVPKRVRLFIDHLVAHFAKFQ
jgi:DNA-binding transcriptional LysR family regulator